MELGIVGYGVVGHALAKLFGGEERVRIYDRYLPGYNSPADRARVNRCDLAFVAVPTPMAADGSADTSAVEEVVAWLEPLPCIKSTVPPGTTDALSRRYGKPICFSPEYVGETPWHPLRNVDHHGFVIVGGPRAAARQVLRAYQEALGPLPRYVLTDPKLAELTKYMENCFLATKVAFANQFYDLAEALQVDYQELRELWLQDDRIGRSHTLVTVERGFGGRCLPKDLAAMIAVARPFGGAPLLEAVQRCNQSVRSLAPPALASTSLRATAAASENGREPGRHEAQGVRAAS